MLVAMSASFACVIWKSPSAWPNIFRSRERSRASWKARSRAGSRALVPLSGVVLLRDLGPLPEKKLRTTAWKKGLKLVNMNTNEPLRPSMLGGLGLILGGIALGSGLWRPARRRSAVAAPAAEPVQ